MKYLKTFEGVKSKLDARIKAHSVSQDFTPNFFIIFTYSDYDWNASKVVNKLILGKIINKEDEVWGSDRKIETYVKIEVIDILNDIIVRNIEGLNTNITKLNLLYKSPSQKSAKVEFENIKEQQPYSEWVMINDMEKYNL